MTILRVQAIQGRLTGLPEDDIVNTFHFEKATVVTADYATAAGHVKAFFDTTTAPGLRMLQHTADQLTDHTLQLKVFNLDDTIPRQPVHDSTYTYASTFYDTAEALPEEVAVTLSFQGTPESGVNQARKRGRVFIGPLTIAATNQSAEGRVFLSSTKATQMVEQMKKLRDDSISSGVRWVVYSPTNDGLALDPAVPVTSGWVDNAFDTQRRRGSNSTARVTFTV